VTVASTIPAEIEVVSNWINELVQEGVELHEIALIVRSGKELPRATGAAKAAGVPYRVVDDNALAPHGSIAVCTMHLAKGLEFRAVAVMACDDEIVPSQDRLASVTDEADLEEVYATERHLFYVAITRARDYLLVTSGDSPSEFLDDLSREELSSR